MTRLMLSTVSCLLLSAGLALAAELSGPAEKAVKEAYPNYTVDIKNTRKINGVTVHDLAVKSKDGASTTAIITESGDWVVAGHTHAAKPMPEAVKSVASGLFKANEGETQPFSVITYTVELTHNGKTYLATLDPVGRITDLGSSGELKEEQSSKMKRDQQNYSKVIKDSELPEAVRQTVTELFPGAKMGEARRYTQAYWRFDHRIGDEVLTLKVREDGDIMGVSSRDAVQPQHPEPIKSQQPTPPQPKQDTHKK